jgi:hypothetical protein
VWFVVLRPPALKAFREGFFMRISSAIRAALITLVAFVGLSPATHADSGTVTLTIYKGGWIIGASGGSGSLYFRGRYYALSTGGLDYGLEVMKAEPRTSVRPRRGLVVCLPGRLREVLGDAHSSLDITRRDGARGAAPLRKGEQHLAAEPEDRIPGLCESQNPRALHSS